MAYITPITDRDLADILAKNSKAYLNVVDWSRVYDNSLTLNTLLASFFIIITFDVVAVPTTATIPTKTYLNSLLINIERMRVWADANMSITDPLFVEIKDDWDEGYDVVAPTYVEVNSWEKVIDLIYADALLLTADRKGRTGIAATGSGLLWNNRFR